ncbi:HK97-gp10 family putative phage morphogenesis protein [Mesorhizobium retamae]|uniref:HK97 gp10 family phage protein n=1 Tax=Mesorhizobium retamae TaxID=2912854 RepID=A0ABS9QPU0_9HYPH|nr:HK97-gp10 family putative phage morphogenesis protein [Mesorhizobium sp. IRAMC:0171]MCG7508873.1 HK97 gp10 family phage protein [Mesorhizobium sp. IRAMC:0171]
MAKGVSVKVEGLRELEQALKQLPKANAKAVLRRTLKEAGEPIAKAARAKAPKFEMYLSESIDVGTKLSRRQAGLHKKQSPVEMFVGPGPDPAAHLAEFGSIHGPAQPFMRPAWDENKDQALETIANLTWLEIEKTAARLAKKAAKGK